MNNSPSRISVCTDKHITRVWFYYNLEEIGRARVILSEFPVSSISIPGTVRIKANGSL